MSEDKNSKLSPDLIGGGQHNLGSNETCVICGSQIPYNKETPINERQCYVVGIGQVCSDCFRKYKSDIKFVESEDE